MFDYDLAQPLSAYVSVYIKFVPEALVGVEARVATLLIDLSLRAIKFHPPDSLVLSSHNYSRIWITSFDINTLLFDININSKIFLGSCYMGNV